MKKLVVCMSVLLTVFSAIAATNVSSVNIVGYTKFTLPPAGGFIQVGVQFDPFDSTLIGVLGTNQLRAASLSPNADKVYIWQTGGVPGYKQYALKAVDKLFHDTDAWSGPATNPILTNGMAMWIQSASTSTVPTEITVLGEVVAATAQTLNIVTGFQMVAYPFSCNVGLQDLSITNGAQSASLSPNADQIYVWENGAYRQFALKSTDGLWHDTAAWSAPAVYTNVNLGQGFWYVSKKADRNWTETNKYLNAFQ